MTEAEQATRSAIAAMIWHRFSASHEEEFPGAVGEWGDAADAILNMLDATRANPRAPGDGAGEPWQMDPATGAVFKHVRRPPTPEDPDLLLARKVVDALEDLDLIYANGSPASAQAVLAVIKAERGE